ncbi:MAG: alpha/beta fold hydrolase [Chloroflexi bacterium]|nr:alpha/beta fold hydrolase [Chloroflexota bacterium]
MTHLHIHDPNPGGNPAVLLLHGLGATGASWTPQLPALTEAGYRPLAPDAPGFGDSPYDGQGWSVRRVAAQMAELLQDLGTGPAHIVGLSMGGVIAQQFARDFPQLTKKLALVSTFAALRPDTLSGWFYFLQRTLAVTFLGLPAQARVVARRVFPAPDQAALRDLLVTTISRADPRAYRLAMRSLGLFDSRKWLHQIAVPTLVITGADDTTVSPERQRNLADGIPGARQVVVAKAGHAVNVDSANEFNRLLLGFLKTHS